MSKRKEEMIRGCVGEAFGLLMADIVDAFNKGESERCLQLDIQSSIDAAYFNVLRWTNEAYNADTRVIRSYRQITNSEEA